MDDQSENTPEKGPVRPSAGLEVPTRGHALAMACEALTEAHKAAMMLEVPADRTAYLGDVADRWLKLANAMWPEGGENAPVRLSAGRTPHGRYAGMGEDENGAQKATESFVPRSVTLPDGRVVHLWCGRSFVEGSVWETRGFPGGKLDTDPDPVPGRWIVTGVTREGVPRLKTDGVNAYPTVPLVEMAEGTLRPVEPPTTWRGVEYPLGSVWTDRDGDPWIVTGVEDDGEPWLKELELVEDPTAGMYLVNWVLGEYGPLNRTGRTA